MNEPSSRTPEGIPHRCDTCGKAFHVDASTAGDACCPHCNTLAWPAGSEQPSDSAESLGLQQNRQQSSSRPGRSRRVRNIRDIRLRSQTSAEEVELKLRRAKLFLANGRPVRISVTFHGRELARRESGRQLVDAWIAALVPEQGALANPPEIRSRRIVCTIIPKS